MRERAVTATGSAARTCAALSSAGASTVGACHIPAHMPLPPEGRVVGHCRVSGIIDFGDMVHAPLINDVAVAASYHLDPETDALRTIAQFARDYQTLSPLTRDETYVLLDLVRARLAMVVAISGWRAARQPENAAYLMRNNAVSWARLAACADLSPEQVQKAIHDA